MRSLRPCSLAPLALALAVVLVGCGGSDASGPSHAEYIAKADAICAPAKAALKKLAKPTGMADAVAYLGSAATIEAKMLGDLRALTVPTADAAALKAIYAQVDVTLASAQKALAAAKAGDQAGMLAALNDPAPSAADKDATAKAKAFGLLVCGTN